MACVRLLAPLGEQAIEDQLGIHLVRGGRGRRAPGDVRLVRPAVAERVPRPGRLAAQLEAGKAGLVADVPRIELVGGDADANGILRLVGLGTGQKARRALAVAASFAVAVGERGVVRQAVKAVEILAGERERPERLGQVDQRPLLLREPGRQVHAVGNVPEAHPDRRLGGLRGRPRDGRQTLHPRQREGGSHAAEHGSAGHVNRHLVSPSCDSDCADRAASLPGNAPMLERSAFDDPENDVVNPVVVGGELLANVLDRTVVVGFQPSSQAIG